MRKWALGIGYLLMIIIGIIYRDTLMEWVQTDNLSDIPLLFMLATFMAFVPLAPFGVVGGIMGMKYGIGIGSLINVLSSTLAAVIMFVGVRYVFRETGRKVLTKAKRVEQFTLLVEKNAFLSVVIGRIIPILPSQLINLYAAFTRMPLRIFLTATVIGKIPVMIVFAVVGDQLLSSVRNALTVLGIYSLFLFVIYWLYRLYITRSSG